MRTPHLDDAPLVYAGPSLWDVDAAAALQTQVRQHVAALLRGRRWSQRELARRLGRSQSAISFLLSGDRSGGSLAFWSHVARVFGYQSVGAFFADAEARGRATD